MEKLNKIKQEISVFDTDDVITTGMETPEG